MYYVCKNACLYTNILKRLSSVCHFLKSWRRGPYIYMRNNWIIDAIAKLCLQCACYSSATYVEVMNTVLWCSGTMVLLRHFPVPTIHHGEADSRVVTALHPNQVARRFDATTTPLSTHMSGMGTRVYRGMGNSKAARWRGENQIFLTPKSCPPRKVRFPTSQPPPPTANKRLGDGL